MSEPAPQLLLRKARETSDATASKPFDQSVRRRTKGSDVNSTASKSSKGKGAVDKRGPSENANEGDSPQAKDSRSKAHNEGERVVIRRLPPGMTQQEFVTILSPDWEVSKGKVDWMSYVPGKTSTDPSKYSRPSRAYLHLMRKDDIMPLFEVVRNATWEDAKATFTSPALVGPPVLELSPYKKIAGTKKRTDARQGTIDQDPEFMAFLESLANPAPMRESIDVEDPNDVAKVETKMTTTPLVEYLKEKKANKGKDGALGKNSKSGGKGKSGSKAKDSKGDKTDKTSKETVKILTKKAVTEQAAEAAKKVASQIATANATTTTVTGAGSTTSAGASARASTTAASGAAPKSRRAGIAAAARILQRDLGLSPGSAHRRARHDAAKAGGDAKAAVASTEGIDTKGNDTPAAVLAEPTQTPKERPQSPTVTPSLCGRRNRGGKSADKGKATLVTETATMATTKTTTAQSTASNNPPVILKKKNNSEVVPKPAESQPPNKAPSSDSPRNSNSNNNRQGPKEKGNVKQSQQKAPSVSTSATRAFVKHVSASQGVNDASLREALGAFGTITHVEIDKRKGFAYVDFSQHNALVKAMTASPISIGQASVQVQERKDKKPVAAAASATCTKESSAPNGEKEKPSGNRGRRGRGGGKAGGGSANGHGGKASAAASKEAAAAAPANTGG